MKSWYLTSNLRAVRVSRWCSGTSHRSIAERPLTGRLDELAATDQWRTTSGQSHARWQQADASPTRSGSSQNEEGP